MRDYNVVTISLQDTSDLVDSRVQDRRLKLEVSTVHFYLYFYFYARALIPRNIYNRC